MAQLKQSWIKRNGLRIANFMRKSFPLPTPGFYETRVQRLASFGVNSIGLIKD
jgi:hypothetical protein